MTYTPVWAFFRSKDMLSIPGFSGAAHRRTCAHKYEIRDSAAGLALCARRQWVVVAAGPRLYYNNIMYVSGLQTEVPRAATSR